MTQEEIDLVFNLSITIYEDPWFKKKKRTREEVQQWVSDQLLEIGIHTKPCGASWGILTI